MRTTRMIIAMVVALVLAGCETVPFGPEGSGEIQVGLQGGGAGESNTSRSLSGSGGGTAEGSVDVRARIHLRTAAGEWVEVTRGAARQTVRADGGDGVQVFARSEVEGGTYGRIRIEFQEVRASLTGGATLDLPFAGGEVRVGLGGDGKVLVEREIDLRVRAGAQALVTINLNTDLWLKQADSSTGTVSKAAFESAVSVTARRG